MRKYVYEVIKINRLEYKDMFVYSELISKDLWRVKSLLETLMHNKKDLTENGYSSTTNELFLDYVKYLAKLEHPPDYSGFYTYDIKENYPNFISSLQKQTYEIPSTQNSIDDVMYIPPIIKVCTYLTKASIQRLKYISELKKEIQLKISINSVLEEFKVSFLFDINTNNTTSSEISNDDTIQIKYKLKNIDTIIYLNRLYYLNEYEKMINYINFIEMLENCNSKEKNYLFVKEMGILARLLYVLRNQILMWDKVKYCAHLKITC
jgi:hypothetical protein